ncbi:TonB-dependent receptor [Gilvimarinus xylanilyticus]|uniref:TonB-dependent receptor n=1 Tax=Gilvimarinus xylanilyticus TaxID=2944139 RepID=A0A9X2I061_9GAMM|nr:TonB-dependent receptor [Gilvimarinus xylanilyticus]MCP8898148.1 TonB-dependent receptor [Gilvimarinus xylanilyticus]
MYTNKSNFKRKLIASAVASCAMSGFAAPTLAQDDQMLEEVVVTGIRASLERSMDIKRDSAGVVDAISSEDIGKFPDTNLAESLQRITGVSINRKNGEGSEITVRGFGPDFNMVTLNGRTMPTGSAYGGSSGAGSATRGGNSRAFDFANLSADSVSGVEVYKTSKASIATGGIGATVNVKTSNPLDEPGLNVSVAGKAIMDTTNRTGDDVTPEVSGIFSWSDDDGMFGVSLSASYSERDSGVTSATVNDWSVAEWGAGDTQTIYDNPANSDIFVNAPEVGQLYSRPNDVRYTFADRTRERTNARLAFQFRPMDSLTASLDYTFAQNDQSAHRGEVTTWVQNGGFVQNVEFDDSAIKTPIFITESYDPARRDVGFSQQYRSQEDTLESTGLNIEWDVTDQFSLVFDAHNSTMESLPTGPGRAGSLDIGVGSSIKSGASWQFSGADIPNWTHTIDGDLEENLSSSVMRVFSVEQTSEVDQFKVDGHWEFDNGSRFDFGIERREMNSNTVSYNGNNNQVLGGWGASAPGEFPDGSFEPFNVAGEFDDPSTGNSPPIGFRADARELGAFLVEEYSDQQAYIGVENTEQDAVRNSASNNEIQEDTDAVYVQFGSVGQLADFEVNVLAGLRYETTDQTSSSETPPLAYYIWSSDNDFTAVSASPDTPTVDGQKYDVLLPSLDFSMNFSDNLIGRASYSQTIARPGLSSLGSVISFGQPNGSTLNAGTTVEATGQNPQLAPLESSNVDVSLEWYYDDASYASVGLFEKRVENFTGSEITEQTFDIRDQTAGPRALAARDALESIGANVDNANLYAMMQILANPSEYPGGASELNDAVVADLNDQAGYEFITPNADDPLMEYEFSTTINNREAKLYGAEFALQHFFGETGFGVQANYTIVRGDVKFDNLDITSDQFALLGLSDTANLVLMYENYGFETRLAYNWRDEYLNQTNWGSNNPGYVEAQSQLDMNISYYFTDNLSVSFEGINMTGEDRREHGRNENMMIFYDDLGARYQLGARYSF